MKIRFIPRFSTTALKTTLTLAAALGCFSSPAKATILSEDDIPAALKQCATCYIDPFFGEFFGVNYSNTPSYMSATALGNMEDYTTHLLVRYQLSPSSTKQYHSNINDETVSYPTPDAVWMSIPLPSFYDFTPQNPEVTLYFPSTPATPDSQSWSYTFKSWQEMASGRGYIDANYPSDDSYDTTIKTNLSVRDVGLCLSVGCYSFLNLNLLGIQFELQPSGDYLIGFNPNDPRKELISSGSGYREEDMGSWYATHLYVQSVPLPTSLWLFASGLIGIGTLARKKKTQLIH